MMKKCALQQNDTSFGCQIELGYFLFLFSDLAGHVFFVFDKNFWMRTEV
jgi:hypothetical protein